jgi:hypothetical protein
MRFTAFLILVLIGAFTGTAIAAEAATTLDPSLVDITRQVFDAVMHSQWWVAASLGVVMICAGVRKYLPAAWKTGTKGDIVGTATTFVMAFAGAIGTWAVAPGAAMTGAVALTALKIGAAAIGGYTAVHKIATWLLAWGKLPPWAVSILRMATLIIGSNAVAKAQAAGAAAVAASPVTGMAGSAKITEIE